MSYRDRALVGLMLIFISIFILYYGSPMRTGVSMPDERWAYSFLGVFTLGFTLFTMGVLGHQDAYTAFVSGFVLYLLVGGVITLTLYVTQNGIHTYTLDDAGEAAFWFEFMRLTITWPLRLVQLANLMGWGDTVGSI